VRPPKRSTGVTNNIIHVHLECLDQHDLVNPFCSNRYTDIRCLVTSTDLAILLARGPLRPETERRCQNSFGVCAHSLRASEPVHADFAEHGLNPLPYIVRRSYTDKAWTQLVLVVLVSSTRKQHAIPAEPRKSPAGMRSLFATVVSNAARALRACTEMRLSKRGRSKKFHKAKMAIVCIAQCKLYIQKSHMKTVDLTKAIDRPAYRVPW
jgi:hypothetical protein